MLIEKLSEITEEFLSVLSELSEVNLSVEEAKKIQCSSIIYVAILDSKIIGTTSLFIEQKFLHSGGRVGHIEDVVVSQDHRGKGIGERLVEAAIAEAKSQGCYKVILDCFEHVKPFYEKLGFREFNIGMRIDII